MRALGRAPQGVGILARIVFADGAARLHRIDDDAVVDELESDAMARPGHRPLDRRAVANLPVEREIARCGVPHQRLPGSRARAVSTTAGSGSYSTAISSAASRAAATLSATTIATVSPTCRTRLRAIAGCGGITRGRSVAVGDGAEARDRADPVADEVFAGKDGEDPRRGNGGGRVDRADARMRMWRAQHEGIGLARTVEVVEVVAVTGDKAPILDAPDRLTDAELLHGTSPPTPHIGGEDRFCYNGRPRFC